MRTSKPISTISYNSQEFLISRLDELLRNHKISDYVFINHFAEEDETKNHIHLWIKPNTLLDTMDLQEFFKELDPAHPTKPLGCIDFRTSKPDDFILYCEHFAPYLASKQESREYHYTRDDFVYPDEDNFNDLYNHAHKGSEWARQNQILLALMKGQVKPEDLIYNGTVPLQQAGSLLSLLRLGTYNGTVRGGRKGHEESDDFKQPRGFMD